MKMKSKILEIWNTYSIHTEEKVIIGVSGGVDSMVLLDLISEVHPISSIIVCHINHGLRKESKEDLAFVKAYTMKRGIQFESIEVDIASISKEAKISIEMTGREIRYWFFEKLRQSEKARFIITAHHRNDSIETMLLNLIKWARLRGLSGISERQGVLLRPLIHISKKEIQAYAEKTKIPFREDFTNTHTIYQRNRVRCNILPEFEAINPEYVTTLWNTIQYFKWLHEMMEWLIGVYLATGSIDEKTFENMSPLLRHTLIEYIYASIWQTTLGLHSRNIIEIERYILTARGGTKKIIGKLLLEKKERRVTWKENC
jgi:tRNA(Ile)-lysidine synthase